VTDPIVIVLVGAVAILAALNAWHMSILGRRIDNVHKRLDLTLEDNGLKDFWHHRA
jgi:hypothetical protein